VNVNNLRALAKFLRELADPARFDMAFFMVNHDVREYEPKQAKQHQNECGTVACAVGHAPRLFPVIETDQTWGDYSERVFGVRVGSSTWTFMFGGAWSKVDNTPLGAAKRIEYVLRGGDIPDSHTLSEMQAGRIHICYE
jgi:hypothetical protein